MCVDLREQSLYGPVASKQHQSGATYMTTETDINKRVILRLYAEVWNRGDMAVAADILVHPKGVQRYVAEFRAAFPDVHHEVQEMIAQANAVAVHWTARATHTGPWHELAATGRSVTWEGVTIAHFTADRIIDHHTVWDRLAFAGQLDALESDF
jgi:predicted ester cyclase